MLITYIHQVFQEHVSLLDIHGALDAKSKMLCSHFLASTSGDRIDECKADLHVFCDIKLSDAPENPVVGVIPCDDL